MEQKVLELQVWLVHFEKRKPQGTDNLFGLLHALKKIARKI